MLLTFRVSDSGSDARNDCIIKYLPLVSEQSGMLLSDCPPSVERDDLDSEGHLALIRGVDQFRENRGVPLENYLKWKIRNAMIDYLRTLRRDESLDEGAAQSIPDEAQLPDQQVREFQVHQRLKAAVIELPVRERGVIRELYHEGKTQSQVAKRLGITQAGVVEIKRRALRSIRPAVEVAQIAA